jgi:hypothetical protein
LSTSLLCTRCGFQNQPGYQFCTNCGAPLGAPPGAPPAGAPPPVYAVPPGYPSAPGYPPVPGYYPPPGDYDRSRQIDRTKTGVLLLLIGALLGWIPLGISIIGAIISFIGAILVIIGRAAFGAKHSRNVVIAVVLYILSIVGLFVVGIIFAVTAIVPSIVSGTIPTVADLQGAINTLLIGSIITSFIGGLAQVLFTYEIQDQPGRILLFAGLGASVALQVAIFFLITPLIATAIADALAGGTFSSVPITDLQNQMNTYALLAVVANLLWAAAYYLVWSRINRGEIPAKLATAPRYPAMPPQAPPPGGPAPPINPQ